MEPIYTLSSCNPAYQLRWSLAIFPTCPIPPSSIWLTNLNAQLRADGIRILSSSFSRKGALLLLVSTQPHLKPLTIVQRVKGRLQYELKDHATVGWRRNFRPTTVGNANAETVENYVATQSQHHNCEPDHRQSKPSTLVWQNLFVELTEPIFSSHGQYVLGLHLVLVHAERWRCGSTSFLEKTQRGMLATAAKYGCVISRLSILGDHLHATMRFRYDLSPGELALACMNNTAFCHSMLRLWMDSYYVGTIGSYDMDAVRS